MDFAQIKELKEKIFAGYQITTEEALALSQTRNIEALYYSANQIRAKMKGRVFEICSGVKVESAKCQYNCEWCAFSQKSTLPIKEYNIVDDKTAIDFALKFAAQKVSRLSLIATSNDITDHKLTQIIELSKKIADKSGLKLCATLGHLTKEQFQRLKNESRITTFQCNLHTSPELYQKLCTSCSYQKKLETIENAQKAGFDICCGLIIGMGETMLDRINVAIKIRELGVKSIPIHILSAQDGVNITSPKPLDSEEILTTISVFRFINPRAVIRLGGGRSLIKIIESEALRAGINSWSIDSTIQTEKGISIDSSAQRLEKEGFII